MTTATIRIKMDETLARLDKACGKSFIAEGQKCTKQVVGRSPKAEPSPNKKRTSNVAGQIAAGLGISLGVTGAASAIALMNQPFRDKVIGDISTKLYDTAQAGALEKLDLMAEKVATVLPPDQREKFNNLRGEVKYWAATKITEGIGFKNASFDKDGRFAALTHEDGDISLVGKSGRHLVEMEFIPQEDFGGSPMHEVQFKINTSFTKKVDEKLAPTRKELMDMTKTLEGMFTAGVSKAKNDSFLYATAENRDGKGDRRASLYKRFGFIEVDGALYAYKNSEGKIEDMSDPDIRAAYTATIRDEKRKTKKDSRLDKACGKSYIAEGQKCTKPVAQQKSSLNNSAIYKAAAIGAGAGFVGSMLASYGPDIFSSKDVLPDEARAKMTKALTTAAGVAVVGATLGVLGRSTYEVLNSNLRADQLPPKVAPKGFYDTLRPGDIIYKGIDFAGGQRAHYAVYYGKVNGVHKVVDTRRGMDDGTIEKLKAINEKINALPTPKTPQEWDKYNRDYEKLSQQFTKAKDNPREQSAIGINDLGEPGEGETSYGKARRLNPTNPAPTTEQLFKIVSQIDGRAFDWTGFENNCETFSRALVNDLPISSQAREMSKLTADLTHALLSISVLPKSRKGFMTTKQVHEVSSKTIRGDSMNPKAQAEQILGIAFNGRPVSVMSVSLSPEGNPIGVFRGEPRPGQPHYYIFKLGQTIQFKRLMTKKDAGMRTDKKCGKSGISEGEKCTVGTQARNKSGKVGRDLALGAAGTALLVGGAMAYGHRKKGKAVSEKLNPPVSRAQALQDIERILAEMGQKNEYLSKMTNADSGSCGCSACAEKKKRPKGEAFEKVDAMDSTDLSSLERNGDGKVYYQGRWWKPNEPVPSTAKGKKKMVLAVKDGKVKVVHFGAEGYGHNYSEEARKSYLARSGGIKGTDDKHSANYWARKVLWAGKGGSVAQPKSDAQQKADALLERLDKKCGKSGVPDNAQCTKGEGGAAQSIPSEAGSPSAKGKKGNRVLKAAVRVGATAVLTGIALQSYNEYKQAKNAREEPPRYAWGNSPKGSQEWAQWRGKQAEETNNARRRVHEELSKKLASESDWHKTLGVDKDATPAQIKAAFRQKAKESHPDTGGSAEKFAKIQKAWENAQAAGKVKRGDSIEMEWFVRRLDQLGKVAV